MQSDFAMAAQELAAIQLHYANKGLTLSQAALCGSPNFIEWQHYPRNDLSDSVSGYEFYYHAHSARETPPDEHGHFHLFKRDLLNQSSFIHLIGISLNQMGLPVRIFTTNQWVTGEQFQWADQVMEGVHHFHLETKGRMAPISRWLVAFMRLFANEIEQLVLARDLRLASLSEVMDLEKVLELRDHHILTQCNINLMERLSEHLLIRS
jgi:hypothetical protein